jgi:hypothetical protein
LDNSASSLSAAVITRKGLAVFDARIVLVGVPSGIPVSDVGTDSRRHFLCIERHAVAVGPGDTPELIVESLDDVRRVSAPPLSPPLGD